MLLKRRRKSTVTKATVLFTGEMDDDVVSVTSVSNRKCSEASASLTSISSSEGGSRDDSIEKAVPHVVEVLSSANDECLFATQMLQDLTPEELEIAARSSYLYLRKSKENPSGIKDLQDRAAMSMAKRHLRADNGDIKKAMKHFKDTIAWRKKHQLDILRGCYETNTEESLQFRRQINKYIGRKGKMVIQGYDNGNRSVWHWIGKNSPEGSQSDPDACMVAHLYMLEKSLACSEAKSVQQGLPAQEMVNVSVDFSGFKKTHAPPLYTVKDLLLALQNHYPERLFHVYLVDAPLIFRGLWKLIQPFVDQDTQSKFVFVTGPSHRRKIFEKAMGTEQCMKYQHPEGTLPDSESINISKFLSLSFEASYDTN